MRPWPLGSVPEPWRPEAREDAGACCVSEIQGRENARYREARSLVWRMAFP